MLCKISDQIIFLSILSKKYCKHPTHQPRLTTYDSMNDAYHKDKLLARWMSFLFWFLWNKNHFYNVLFTKTFLHHIIIKLLWSVGYVKNLMTKHVIFIMIV